MSEITEAMRRGGVAVEASDSASAGSSADRLDDLDQLVHAVALAAGEVDELSCLLDDGAALGRPGDGDATAASELE